MANILLIYPQPMENKESRFGFSLNLLYLSSIIKKAGHHVILKDYSTETQDLGELSFLLRSTDVAIIEYDSFPLKRSLNINNGEILAEFIKQNHNHVKIFAFGYDCILFPRHIKNTDYTFTVEPEASINNAINQCLNGQIVNNFHVDVLDNIDELPFPDRSILSEFAEYGGTIFRQPNLAKSTLIQTSRGCLNTCTFCQRKGWLKKYRPHSINYVVDEFKEIKRLGYVNIWICDDNFTFTLSRAKELLTRLIEQNLTDGMRIALSSWVNIDFEFLKLAKEANISLISFGIESANNEILSFYKKKIDLTQTKNLIRYADQLGVYTVGNFIVGAPMETDDTIAKTFKYIKQVPLDQVNIKILDYMIGSDLYETLPDKIKKGRRHIFACKENDLNDLPFEYLKSRIRNFEKEFRQERKEHFMKKAHKFGFPYYLKE